MPKERTILRRRIAPSTPLSLELVDDSGDKFTKNFRLSLDYNAASYIELKSGFGFLDGEIWGQLNATTISIMLYAAVLANHPEYWTVDRNDQATDEGLEVIRSYMDMENTEQITKALNDAYVSSLPPDKKERALKAQAEAEARAENPTKPAATPSPMPIATAAGG
jgi:hypothetical protein